MDERARQIILMITFVSIFLEIVVIPVPSVVSTYQLAQKKKTKHVVFSFIGLIIIYLTFFLPLLNIWLSLNLNYLFQSGIVSYLGLLSILGGRFVTIWSAVTIRRRNRNKNQQSHFVTDGPYQFSRNPGLLGMYFTIFGIWLICPLNFMIPGIFFYLGYMHVKVRMEERFLENNFGRNYSNYFSGVRRYL